jgi:hypothetical protein
MREKVRKQRPRTAVRRLHIWPPDGYRLHKLEESEDRRVASPKVDHAPNALGRPLSAATPIRRSPCASAPTRRAVALTSAGGYVNLPTATTWSSSSDIVPIRPMEVNGWLSNSNRAPPLKRFPDREGDHFGVSVHCLSEGHFKREQERNKTKRQRTDR